MSEAKKMILFSVFGILVLTLSVSGVAYSFVNNEVKTPGEEASSLLVKDEELSVVFEGKALIDGSYLQDNEQISKTFTVENTATGAVSYNIIWNYIDNEYTDTEGLTYTLSNNGKIIVEATNVPQTGSNIPILKNTTLEKNETNNYILTISYKKNSKIKAHEQTLKAKIGVINNKDNLK